MRQAVSRLQSLRGARRKPGAALTVVVLALGSVAFAGGALADPAGAESPAPADRTGTRTQQCTTTAPAGVEWVAGTSAADKLWRSVAWGNGTFVAVSDGGSTGTADRVMTSPDGITWTGRAVAADNGWTSVVWGGPAGQEAFVTVSGTGTGNRVMTSPDGITWTSRSSAANNVWTSVTWGGPAGQEKFVAVSVSGTGNRVMTSPDGITWTSRSSAADNRWTSVAWGGPAGQETFVAVSDNGAGNRVMTSPDGITWTAQLSAADNGWTSVTWGGPAGQERFVAVSETGAGNRVMTSPDGITWTAQTSAADNQWRSIAWSGELFAAVSDTGTGDRVMTSPDGITWTSQTSPANNAWYSVAWGNGTFVSVSLSGTGNRVMTSIAQQTCITPVPRVPPGPPRDVTATPSVDGAVVTWAPPADPGTDSVNLYAVRAWPGGPVCQLPASTLTCTVTELDDTQDYYFTVVAMSSAGWGSASEPSNTIRPLAPEPPGAPTDVAATPGNGQATLTWTAPSASGSSAVGEYRVASSPEGGSCTSTTPGCTVTGLTNGTAYTFTVEARNDQGWGPASQASAAVTPQAPAIVIQGERSRSGRTVTITGTVTGIGVGTPVEVWIRLGRSGPFVQGSSTVVVQPNGAVEWMRRVNAQKRVEVYLIGGDTQSNTVVLPRTRGR